MEVSAEQDVFSNPLLVKLIANALPSGSLKCFRLVSRLFHQASLPVWRKRATLLLHPGNKASNEFIPQLDTPGDFFSTPFRKVRLTNCSLPSSVIPDRELNAPQEFEFYSKYGRNITHLHIHSCAFDERKLVNLLVNYFPFLKALVINGIQGRYRGQHTELWTPHLHLEKLEVTWSLPFPSWNFLHFLPSIKEVKLLKFQRYRDLEGIGNLQKQTRGGKVIEGNAQRLCNQNHSFYDQRPFVCCWRIAFSNEDEN